MLMYIHLSARCGESNSESVSARTVVFNQQLQRRKWSSTTDEKANNTIGILFDTVVPYVLIESY